MLLIVSDEFYLVVDVNLGRGTQFLLKRTKYIISVYPDPKYSL